MTLETYRKTFIECLKSFNILHPYLDMDVEYKNRDYNTLVKEKVSITEVKKWLKAEFSEYSISNKYGGIYLRKKTSNLLLNFFFKFNGHIFLPYYEIFLNEESSDNMVNYTLNSGSSICKYLLNDDEYPMKAKIFSNSSELIHLISNEVVFFEKFTDEYIKKLNQEEC